MILFIVTYIIVSYAMSVGSRMENGRCSERLELLVFFVVPTLWLYNFAGGIMIIVLASLGTIPVESSIAGAYLTLECIVLFVCAKMYTRKMRALAVVAPMDLPEIP
mmetsp:Transcript_9740/g.11636  ORF Transcript_9740/g.11636 Transcript_9740/m.11636 type:complete len:106 (+) Transcript_9740:69-386(+)